MKKNNISNREREVLDHLAMGFTAKEIANIMYISTETVHSHRSALIVKLDVKNTAHLISKSYQQGLLGDKANHLLQYSNPL